MASDDDKNPQRIAPHFWLNAVGTAALVGAFRFQASMMALSLGFLATSLTSYGGSLYLWRTGRPHSPQAGSGGYPQSRDDEQERAILLLPPPSAAASSDEARPAQDGVNVAFLPARDKSAPKAAAAGGASVVSVFPLTRCRFPNETPADHAARIARLRAEEKGRGNDPRGPGDHSPGGGQTPSP